LYPTFKINIEINAVDEALTKQLAIKDITICPALMLAISRTVKVKGRIRILIVSTKTRKGTNAAGAPAGAKCAAEAIGFIVHPLIRSNPHITTANEDATQRFLVTP